VLSDGTAASAQVPSGASTGRHEALELRDGDSSRYGGKGVRRAVANVENAIGPEVIGSSAEDLPGLDRTLIALDGTPNKSRLGANAILGVSCAVARALATSRREPLWRTLAGAYAPEWTASLPLPMINILSGGWHAAHNIEIQDFLVMPHGFDTYSDALHAAVAVHGAAREVIEARGFAITGVADEGGWGPRLSGNEDGLRVLTEAIERAGYRPGVQCSIALDVASSHFFRDGRYELGTDRRSLEPAAMVELLERWTREYPVVSIEDGLDQDDWQGWALLTERLSERVQVIGDDFFTTNPARVRRGIAERTGNAVLVKMNQIGTLAETFEVLNLAAGAGWRAVVSARSGETEDSFLADLAAASGAGQIKVGSITRSERLAKYNRLLELERGGGLPFARFAIRPD
jgi:enolase